MASFSSLTHHNGGSGLRFGLGSVNHRGGAGRWRFAGAAALTVPRARLPMHSPGSKTSRVGGLKSAEAALIPKAHLTMQTPETKTSTLMDEIRSLRLITAVKTPYLPDGRFDLEAYDSLVQTQIASGADGILVAGTTGEGYLMTWEEQISLIAHTVNSFGSSAKVIGNAGSNCTREAHRATEMGFAVGMHAAMHINPYYGKTSERGMVAHFRAVLPFGPVIIYNNPTYSAQDIPPSVVHELWGHPNLAGVKECAGNERVRYYTEKGIVTWSAGDGDGNEARWEHGAVGLMSVVSNLVPGMMHEIMTKGRNPELNARLQPLLEWVFQEPIPIGISTALAQLGVVRPVFRMPHQPLAREKRVEFVGIVEAMGRHNFVGEGEVRVLDDDEFVSVYG